MGSQMGPTQVGHKIRVIRSIHTTPATTNVAAWMTADTAVGPSIASGSHPWIPRRMHLTDTISMQRASVVLHPYAMVRRRYTTPPVYRAVAGTLVAAVLSYAVHGMVPWYLHVQRTCYYMITCMVPCRWSCRAYPPTTSPEREHLQDILWMHLWRVEHRVS